MKRGCNHHREASGSDLLCEDVCRKRISLAAHRVHLHAQWDAGSGVEFHFLLVSLVWFLYRCFLMSSQPAAQRLLTPHGACYTSRRSHAPSRATPRSTSRHAPHTHPARPASVSKHRLLLATLQLCISKHVLGVCPNPFFTSTRGPSASCRYT